MCRGGLRLWHVRFGRGRWDKLILYNSFQLMFGISHHQLRHNLAGIATLKENEGEFLGDGHLDVVEGGELERGPRGENALGHGMGRSEDIIELFAGGQAAAKLLVTAQGAGAGGNEVSYAGKAGESERMSASGNPQARDLRQTTGDEGGFGIIAEAHAVVEARADGNDILQGPTQFDAYHIIRRIDAIERHGQEGAGVYRYIRLIGSDDGGGWLFLSHLARNIGTAERRDMFIGIGDLLADDLCHALKGADLYTLAGAYQQRFFMHIGREQAQVFAHTLRGSHQQEHFFPAGCLR